MKLKKLLPWLAGIFAEAAAVVFCIIYAVTNGARTDMYAELLVAAAAPFLVPIYGIITKKPLPAVLSVAIAVFVFLACNLGSAMEFYADIACWDLIMHGTFGFLCSVIFFTLLVRWNGSSLNPVGFMIIIFTVTMGVAALWEVWEYTADLIFGNDAQRVQESIALGKSPVADTMEDIIITMAGIALFYVTFFVDKLRKYSFYGKFCGFNGFEMSQKT